MMIKYKKIFITGGAGYLGKNLIERWYDTNQITVFSRDEAKHYFLKKQYPRVKFIVGDVRNYDLLFRAAKDHDIGVFAASLKQIEACDDNYEEANRIIVEGSFNSKRCAVEHNYEAACFISSDKSRAATTIYGAMKYIAGESFIMNTDASKCRCSTAIYGNILNSTGSIIPLIWQHIKNKNTLNLYHPDMTRFLLTVEDAMKLIEISLNSVSVNVIPACRSFKIKDLLDLYTPLGLKYEVTKPRPNEKIHEIMASHEELPRMQFLKEVNCYIMYQDKCLHNVTFPNNEYSSRDVCVDKDELRDILSKNNYFNP